MLKQERLDYILDEIRTYNKVKSSALSSKLSVSEDTIRRDLKELSDKGKIKKVHGGALSSSYIPFSHKEREIYAHEEKVRIVKKARKLIKDDMVIAMDGGTTNLELVRLFPKEVNVSVITNSLPIAVQLTEMPNVDILFLGGKILKSAQVAVGIDVVEALGEFTSDLCFVGTRSLHHNIGLTDIDREEAMVKRAIIENSAHVVCLALSEKLDTTQPYKIAPVERINSIITELDRSSKILQKYINRGINIL